MKFGSVCSGIEAASVAWHPLGWGAAWLAEIEPFPSAVLAHHYPSVVNLGDMTKIASSVLSGDVEAPDVLVGGTPCQAFSVAGLRKSLDDERGQLSISFIHLADAIDAVRRLSGRPACIVTWENVPGVLSTKDNAFGCFLAGLVGEDSELQPAGGKWSNAGCVYGPKRAAAWRVLDAQYFGVAQRRRRVFVVASAREGFDPAAVLFEFDGVRRDSAPSRETGEGVAGTFKACASSGGWSNSADHAAAGYMLPVMTMAHGQGGAEIGFDRGPKLTCNHEAPIAAYALQHAQIGRKDEAGQQGKGWQKEVAFTQDSRSCADAVAVCVTGQVTHTLKAEGFDASEDGAGRGQPIVAYQNPAVDAGNGAEISEVATFLQDDATVKLSIEIAGTLRRDAGGQGACVKQAMQVRRLTPRECERLQGFPDDYTLIPWRKKPAEDCPDGPRYKALGNSMAVPVMSWIGKRINNAIKKGGAV